MPNPITPKAASPVRHRRFEKEATFTPRRPLHQTIRPEYQAYIDANQQTLEDIFRGNPNAIEIGGDGNDAEGYPRNIVRAQTSAGRVYYVKLEGSCVRYEARKKDATNSKPIYKYAVKGNVLGEGSFGRVYDSFISVSQDGKINVKENEAKRRIIKEAKPRIIGDTMSYDISLGRDAKTDAQIVRHSVLHEYEMLSKITAVKNPILKADSAFLISRHYPGNTLDRLIGAKTGPLSSTIAMQLSVMLFADLNTIHNKNLIHRDIKSNNIMVDAEFKDGKVVNIKSVKIVDFGLSIPANTNLRLHTGNHAFISSENWRNEPLSQKTDVQSLGKVLWTVWGDNPHPRSFFPPRDKKSPGYSAAAEAKENRDYMPPAEVLMGRRGNDTPDDEHELHYLIHELMTRINHSDPEQRISSNTALVILETYNQWWLEKVAAAEKAAAGTFSLTSWLRR